MKSSLIQPILISILLSLVTSKIVYFGFTPNYAADIFSKQAFNGRFDHDVYKYRILSKYLLFKVDKWLGRTMPEKGAENRILINTKEGSERFYYAFYYLNTFFLILTSILMILLLNLNHSFKLSESEQYLIIFLVPVVICLSQFTVCMYDVSSYFFQLLILYIYLRYIDQRFIETILFICLIVILSTLNRESSALSVSMIALLLFKKMGITKKSAASIASIAFSFLVTYLALRNFIVDRQHIRIINIQAGQFLIDTNIIGLIFWGLFFYLPMVIANSNENRYMIAFFHLLSLPYILICLKDGVLWEVRLYVPLFISSLFLSKLTPSGFTIHLKDLLNSVSPSIKKKPEA